MHLRGVGLPWPQLQCKPVPLFPHQKGLVQWNGLEYGGGGPQEPLAGLIPRLGGSSPPGPGLTLEWAEGSGVQGQMAEAAGDGRVGGGALTPSSRASPGASLRPKALVLPGQPPPGLCPGRALVAGPPFPQPGRGRCFPSGLGQGWGEEGPPKSGRRRCIAVQGGGDPFSQFSMQKGSKKRSEQRSDPRSRPRIHLCCPQPGLGALQRPLTTEARTPPPLSSPPPPTTTSPLRSL